MTLLQPARNRTDVDMRKLLGSGGNHEDVIQWGMGVVGHSVWEPASQLLADAAAMRAPGRPAAEAVGAPGLCLCDFLN